MYQHLSENEHLDVMQRVLINSDGDMIVRPSFIEASVQRRSTSSVVQHLLINYQRAHVAIIKAQFTSKRLRDGMLVCVFPFPALQGNRVYSGSCDFSCCST